MKKRTMSLLLVSLMLLVFNPVSNAFAASDTKETIGNFTVKQFVNGQKYLFDNETGEKVVKAFGYNEEGEIEEISLTEYAQIMSAEEIPDTDANQIAEFKIEDSLGTRDLGVYTFTQTSSSTVNGSAQKVTADVVGPATITVLTQKSITESFTASGGVTTSIKSAIRAGASFTWNKTLKSATTVGYSFSVDSGRTGYVSFTPYLRKTFGTLKYYDPTTNTTITVGSASGTCPKKTSTGFADGLYALKYK